MDARLVGAERLMRDMRAIAQWERLSGSPEERKAFEYIERELRAERIRTQLLEHPALISLPQRATFRLVGPGGTSGEELPCITHSFSASTAPMEAPVIYLPDDAGAPKVSLLAQVVVTDGPAMPNRVAELQRARAAAAVFLNRDPMVHEMIVSTVWGSPTPDRVAELPTIPVVSMAGSPARRLREVLETGGPVRAVISTQVETSWRMLPLLVADLPGVREDTFVLLAGHVDSWYLGAMDNAGANAAMMEIARLMASARRYRGLKVAFWSGHSHGRYAGSTWYADTCWDELDRNCAVHLYIDSVGGRGATVLTSSYCMPETKAVGAAAIRKVAGQKYEGARVGRAGDQSFLGIGIPSLFMTLSEHPPRGPESSRDFAITGGETGGLGWWWHTPEDTPDKIDPANLARDTAIYFEAIRTLCGEPFLPLDYVATTSEIVTQLQALQTRLGDRFDLSGCLAEARALERAVRGLRARARKIGTGRWRHVEAINRTLMRLGRVLIPALYTQSGRFDHDPATSIPPLPPLAGAEALAGIPSDSPKAHALMIALTRGRNRLIDALRRAREIAEEAAG